MPKTLLVATGFPPDFGGIQRVLFKIASDLSPEEIIVIAPEIAGARKFDAQCEFEIIRRSESVLSKFVRKLLRLFSPVLAESVVYLPSTATLMKVKNIDVILCGHISVGLVGYFLKKIYGSPYVLYTYAQEILQAPIPKWKILDKAAKKLVLDNADAIITISDYTSRKILQWGVDQTKIVKITPGADLAGAVNQDQAAKIINRLSLRDKKIVLTVTRLVERKGVDTVIEALPKVLENVPNVIYLIVGSGPMEKFLKERVHNLNLEQQVIFCGDVSSEIKSVFYSLCDIFIMPSRALEESGDVEGFGIVYLEANAYGKPVIGGNSGGVPDAVLDGVTGLLVDPNNVEEIAGTIIRLLTQTDYARELGENGRCRVETEMNWTRSAEKVQQLLEDIVKNS